MSDATLPYADSIPYWKTGRSSPDIWIGKTKQLLSKIGAKNVDEAFLSIGGKTVFALSFTIGTETFRVSWPVLRIKDPKDEPAARIQAATLLYHECKARCLAASVLGSRSAFVSYLVLPGGSTVMESSSALIAEHSKPAGFLGLKS